LLDKRCFFSFATLVLLVGIMVILPPQLVCQNSGFKYLKNYSPKEYNGQPQNWSILQDRRGVIYVGNSGGLLEFDGVSWRSIPVPNESVRSMTIHEDGTIYLGGKNQMGFLKTNPRGTLEYQSLTDYLPEAQRKFNDVWKTHALREKIYFRTSHLLFCWDPASRQMKAWEDKENKFNASFACQGKLYIHKRNTGLMQLDGGAFHLLPGGDTFKDVKIYMLVSYTPRQLLIGTQESGFFIFDLESQEKKPFPTAAAGYLNENELYHGIRLSSSPGDFALATLRGGLVIIDSQGQSREIFTLDYGLQDDNVRYVFEDSQGNLWLGLNYGISKIEYRSPLSVYDGRSNLAGMVLSVTRHRNRLYAGTAKGLFRLNNRGKFVPVPRIPGMGWSLLSTGDSLLASTTFGVFLINRKDHIREMIKNQSYALLQSGTDERRIWVGTREGLVSLYFPTKEIQDGTTTNVHSFADIHEEIRSLVEDREGNLWLGTLGLGVIKVDFAGPGRTGNYKVTRFGTSQGLPPGDIHVFTVGGQVKFATEKGVFRRDEKKTVFFPDSTFGSEFSDGSRSVFILAEDHRKNIWLHSNGRNIQAMIQPDGTYTLHKKPFLRIPLVQVNTIYPDPNGKTVFFASHEGLIRYDTTIKKKYQENFTTMIRSILVNGTLRFDSISGNAAAPRTGPKPSIPVFPFQERNFRFQCAAPFFEDESSLQYQYFLEGLETHWSDWTTDTKKDYINLDSGVYTFRVRAKNVYEDLGTEAIFQFQIRPPVYKTWWAFGIYAVFAVVFVLLIVRWRSWKLEREKEALGEIIKERTKEINSTNQQLEAQTMQLKEQSRKLKEMDKMKSRFFTNISHEFRTPLTLIMGPLEQMISESREQEQKKQLNLMLKNSKRLLTLINQLLDLSKFDSGKMKLQASRQNIIPFLKGILASFELLITQKQVKLQAVMAEEDITLYFDPEKLEQVICNLLINAVKFTPAGGTITVEARMSSIREEVQITVRDTGIGIPKDQLGHIFNRFYQAGSQPDESSAHGGEGTGIGLALARELVVLHHGRIEVCSDEGKGTEFLVQLPLGNRHLKDHERVSYSDAALKPQRAKEMTDSLMAPGEYGPVREKPGPQETPAEKPKAKLESRKKQTILVVDDSPEVRCYIQKSLEPDYKVIQAADGREGLRKANEVNPDLIVSDVMMPELDGYQLCNSLKEDINTSHIPIILLTAKASEENIIQGLKTGADDYITKPFSTKILITRINNLVHQRMQLKKQFQQQIRLEPEEVTVSSIDQKFVEELQETLEKNLSDTELNVEALSEKMNISRVTLNKKILALTDETANQFIRSYRLKRARQLLEGNFGSVIDVALEVGFSSPAYFTKCFRKKFHQVPSDYLGKTS
jgi:signal transduction histidine kinase/DNA-binding response OmpR family regulator